MSNRNYGKFNLLALPTDQHSHKTTFKVNSNATQEVPPFKSTPVSFRIPAMERNSKKHINWVMTDSYAQISQQYSPVAII
jgi:hypothetical protein